MKFLTLAVLTTTLLSTSAKAFEVTLLPLVVVSYSVCDTSNSECTTIKTASVTLTIVSSVLLLKEDIQQVEADAYNFLAGEEISLALEEQMAKVREAAPELADLSDEEIVTIMIEIANR